MFRIGDKVLHYGCGCRCNNKSGVVIRPLGDTLSAYYSVEFENGYILDCLKNSLKSIKTYEVLDATMLHYILEMMGE